MGAIWSVDGRDGMAAEMIEVCVFVVFYSVGGGPMHWIGEPTATCSECAELVAAYLEAGPPAWLAEGVVVPMCVRHREEATPI